MPKWTNKQFEQAIKNFRDGPHHKDIHGRISAAAGLVIRQRKVGNVSDEEISLTPDDIADFLDNLDAKRLRKLKHIAEGLILDGVSVPAPNTRQ